MPFDTNDAVQAKNPMAAVMALLLQAAQVHATAASLIWLDLAPAAHQTQDQL